MTERDGVEPRLHQVYCPEGTESRVEEFLRSQGVSVERARAQVTKYSGENGGFEGLRYVALTANFSPGQALRIRNKFFLATETFLEVAPVEDEYFDA